SFVITAISGPSGLTDAFGLNEGSGTTVRDSSTNKNVGTLVNGPSWTTGKFGRGVSLDGVNDYISVSSPDLPAGNFTWELWMNLTQRKSFQSIMMSRDKLGVEIDLDGNGRVIIYSHGTLRL